MKTFFSTLLVSGVMFFPLFMQAASSGDTHPNVTPPTAGPTEPLPPTTLPGGKIDPQEVSSSADQSTIMTPSTTMSLTNIGIVTLIVGLGGLLCLRRGKRLFSAIR